MILNQVAKSILEYNVDLVRDQLSELKDVNELFQHPEKDVKTSLYHLAIMLPPWNTDSKKKKKQIIDLVKKAGADYFVKDSLGLTPLFNLKRNFGYSNETSSPLKQLVADVDDKWFVLDIEKERLGPWTFYREESLLLIKKLTEDYLIVSVKEGGYAHLGTGPLIAALAKCGPITQSKFKLNEEGLSKTFSVFSPPILKRSFFIDSKIDETGKINDLVLADKLPEGKIFVLENSECIVVKEEVTDVLKKAKGLILVPATHWCSHYL
jgi:hypothetical protein